MTDPLAHLYAETGVGDLEVELSVRETSLEELTNVEAEEEELSDHDVHELALLVRSRVQYPGLPDEEAVELGLGAMVPTERGRELRLTAAGRQVIRHMLEHDFPEIGVLGPVLEEFIDGEPDRG